MRTVCILVLLCLAGIALAEELYEIEEHDQQIAGDALKSQYDHYAIGNSRKNRKKTRVPFRNSSDLRRAILAREILERPRAFDI